MVTLVSTECRLSYCGRIADGGPFGQIAGERGDAGRARRSRVTDRATPHPPATTWPSARRAVR